MFKAAIRSMMIFALSVGLLAPITLDSEPIVDYTGPIEIVEITNEVSDVMDIPEVEIVKLDIDKVAQAEEPKYTLTEEEIELIALVTMAEAEGESELGKRLVIDTILNRVDHEYSYWPDTVHEVIYQKGQFSSMWNGRVDRCYVREDIVQLVREELENRTNSEVVYFRMGKYSKYGTPSFKEGCHYFSNF